MTKDKRKVQILVPRRAGSPVMGKLKEGEVGRVS
jgi:hypothetical protein